MSDRDKTTAWKGTETGNPEQAEGTASAPGSRKGFETADDAVLVKMTNVSSGYGPVEVLRNIDLEIRKGRSSVSWAPMPRASRQH